jgi:hypothetical protein
MSSLQPARIFVSSSCYSMILATSDPSLSQDFTSEHCLHGRSQCNHTESNRVLQTTGNVGCHRSHLGPFTPRNISNHGGVLQCTFDSLSNPKLVKSQSRKIREKKKRFLNNEKARNPSIFSFSLNDQANIPDSVPPVT